MDDTIPLFLLLWEREMSYTTIGGTGETFSLAGYNAKWVAINAGPTYNPVDISGITDNGTAYYKRTTLCYGGTAMGILLDAAGNTMQAYMGSGSIAYPTGHTFKPVSAVITLTNEFAEDTGPQDGNWMHFAAYRGRIMGTIIGTVITEGHVIPADFYTTPANYQGAITLTYETGSMLSLPSCTISATPIQRPYAGIGIATFHFQTNGGWDLTWAANAPFPTALCSSASGYVKANAFGNFAHLIDTSQNTTSGNALVQQCTVSYSWQTAQQGTVLMKWISNGAVTTT
jgi:hypothetical protein